jgi:hypothetical protein
MSESAHSREHYRLRYPLPARPRLVVGAREFVVNELSEGGCRVLWEPEWDSCFVAPSQVVFRFHDGAEVNTLANQLRIDSGEVVLSLEPRVSLKVIIAEQRRVLKEFPRGNGN